MSAVFSALSRIGRVAFYCHLVVGLGMVATGSYIQEWICSLCPGHAFPTIFLMYIAIASFGLGVVVGLVSLLVASPKPVQSYGDEDASDTPQAAGRIKKMRFSPRFWMLYLIVGILVLSAMYACYRYVSQGVEYRLLVEQYDLEVLLLFQYIGLFFTVVLLVGMLTSIANYWRRNKFAAILLVLLLPVPFLPLCFGTIVLYEGFSQPVETPIAPVQSQPELLPLLPVQGVL